MRNLSIPAALAAFAATSLPAVAQTQCAPREVLIERLADRYGETLVGGGLQNGRAVFEIWSSKSDGSWTILMTRANGTSCVMAAGTDWIEAIAVAEGRPS